MWTQVSKKGTDSLCTPAVRANALAIRTATPANVEAAMVKRLVEMGRVQADFEPSAWYADITAQRKADGATTQDVDDLRQLGIYGQRDFDAMIAAHKASDAYKQRKDEKPKSGKKAMADWRIMDQEATVAYYRYTVFPFQEAEDAEDTTTIPQAEAAEGIRYLTHLFHIHSKQEKSKKWREGKKAPSSKALATEDGEDPDEQ